MTLKTPTRTGERFEVLTLRSIGAVELSDNGMKSPVSAAMELIAQDGDTGTYEFTVPAGVITEKAIKFTITIASEEVA